MNRHRVGFQGFLGVEDVRQDPVVDADQFQGLTYRVQGIGSHGGNLVPHEPDTRVYKGKIGCESARQNVERCEDCADTRQPLGFGRVDPGYVGMGMGTAEYLPVKHPRKLEVGRVKGLTGQLLPEVAADDAFPDNVQGNF